MEITIAAKTPPAVNLGVVDLSLSPHYRGNGESFIEIKILEDDGRNAIIALPIKQVLNAIRAIEAEMELE